ncbi:Dnaj protein-like protein [Leishmania tarentolae]|uniref:Dnaj protein-like protein n=1 Tax=Leishmania tarentolae TaxID=5689 RepID=A0A640L022_LEITA|nr:Dnaj protein-like protein [Leishmania tarentolae]
MGLSDIDEDEPVPHSSQPAVILQPPPPRPVLANGSATTTAGSPVTALNHSSTSGNASVLDDLFSNMNVSAPPGATDSSAPPLYFLSSASPTHKMTSTASAAAAASSVLSDLFSAPDVSPSGKSDTYGKAGETHAMIYVDGSSGAGVGDGVTNLFDISKPMKKDRYNNAESFLEAFERQGKKSVRDGGRPDEHETLANLTRNKDDNKVRARLLPLMNYYDVLGVAPTASEEEIKRSYKKKALQLHPDRVGRDQTQEEAELFKVITKAHEVLSDAEQRRVYDASLVSGGGQPAMASSGTGWWSHMQS